jgi:hypothetical protein
MRRLGAIIMQKILFCNLDLLAKGFEGYDQALSKKYRNEFVDYMVELSNEDENLVCFISRENTRLGSAKKHFDEFGYTNFIYKNRNDIRSFAQKHKSIQNCFVFISGKEVDFHVAVSCKALFIVPTWIPMEDKAEYYGVHVDTPEQLAKFIRTLNNHNCVFETLHIEPNVDLFALVDARYKAYYKTEEEKQMLIHFENLLKNGGSRNYYHILMYHFLAGMTRTDLLDDVELYGMIPSSDGSVNPDMFDFMTRTRLIKGRRLPKNKLYQAEAREQNLLIRHTKKQRAHMKYNFSQRATMGCADEFATLCINPEFKDKIKKLRDEGRFNVCIFDDYTTFGNSFNAVRNLLKYLGANKIVFISLGSFVREFKKNNYEITGDVFSKNYTGKIISCESLSHAVYNTDAKTEVDALYDIFNS